MIPECTHQNPANESLSLLCAEKRQFQTRKQKHGDQYVTNVNNDAYVQYVNICTWVCFSRGGDDLRRGVSIKNYIFNIFNIFNILGKCMYR